MRTHTLLTNHFTRLRTLTALLAAVALLGINVGPRRVDATAVDTTVTLQMTTALPLTGTFQTLNNLPGDQTDIHIDCDLASYTDDYTAPACSFINSFINECEAQSGKKLTAAQATQLINSGKQIKTDLNCL